MPANETPPDAGSGPGRRHGLFAPALGGMTAGVVVVASWAYLRLPPEVALASYEGGARTTLAAGLLDAAAGVAVGQLTAATGRSMESIATQVTAQPTKSAAANDTVVGDAGVGPDYAETLAQLEAAEQAAAEQLAISQDQAAKARAEQKAAEAELASAEKAAAREIDDAISAAIAAAEAQTRAVDALPDAGQAVDPTIPDGTPGSQPSGGATTAGAVLALVKKYFPADEVTNAMAVARCESGLRNAVGALNGNGTRDYGIFQINDGGTLQAALRRIGENYTDISDARVRALDSELNVRMAAVLWEARGWQPWVCAAKKKIVSGLYERTPGPMYGRYNEEGMPA